MVAQTYSSLNGVLCLRVGLFLGWVELIGILVLSCVNHNLCRIYELCKPQKI